jgi:hypothetical protein
MTSTELARHAGRVLELAENGTTVEVPRPGGRVVVLTVREEDAPDER